MAAETPVAQPLRAQDAERRQLTVMFCDLVGYTALSERLDPEDLDELVQEYQKSAKEVVKRYDGHVAQEMGDGVMVYFGSPRAHEDDAERCVRAALDIVEVVKTVGGGPPLAVRIGVATGTVVVADGKLAVGETPNLAERLQKLAGPNEIVIAPKTRRLVGDTFELTDLGAHALKGLAEPVRAWRALRVSGAASRFDASHGDQLTPLIGRKQQIGLLLDRQQLACQGAGQVVLLSGQPGIGKSRILNEFREHLEAQGVMALRFQCLPYYRDHAFWPSIDHLERTLKFARDDTSESKLDKLEALMVGEYGLPLSDVRFVASILSIPCEARYGALVITPQKHKDETLRTLVNVVEAAARKRHSAVLFEDAHWVDASTLEVLDLLVERVKHMPLLVVLTHRPEDAADDRAHEHRPEFKNRWARYDYVSAIPITKLTRAQCATMVSRLGGTKALPDDLVEEILNKTDGVPLFVEELTKSILESDKLTDVGDRYEYRGPSRSFTVPTTLEASLMARLDRDTPAKEVAQIGAVIGRDFSYELIAAVAPWPKADLKHALERLTALGLAFRRGTPPDATYSFKHALVQDAAYASLLIKGKRSGLHAKIARAIEERFPSIKATQPEVLAKHYTQAGEFERGAAYWFEAGQKALSSWALSEAIGHLQEALKAIGNMPASKSRDRSELECRVLLGTAWLAYRGWAAPQVAEVLKPALPLARAARQPKLLAPTLWGLWVQMMSVGPVADSLVLAEEALSAGEDLADEELLLVGHMAAMVTNFWLGNPLVVERHACSIMARYVQERHGQIVKSVNHDPKTLAGIYLPLALWILGYPDQAVALLHERESHAHRINHPFDTGFVLTLGAWVFHYRREPEKQYDCNEEIQQLAQESGLPFLSEVLAPYLSTGISLAQMGHLSEGIEHMQTGIRLWESGGARTVTPYIRSRLGEALALSGDVEGGLAHVDAMLEQISRPGWQERSHLAEILRLKGWMLSLKADFAGAEKNYVTSLDWAREQQAKSWELRTATSLARLWQAQGKHKEAYDLLAPVYGWFTEGFDTKDLIEAKALIAELGA